MTKTDPSATPSATSSTIRRWRIARRISLGAIVVAGTMSTAAAIAHRVADHPCQAQARTQVNSYYTYSGIGVELAQEGEDFVVHSVFPGSPADGKIYPGATLLKVNGEHPTGIGDWARMIRGQPGSTVELEVVYPCQGHETVTLDRAIIHIDQVDLPRR